MIKFWTAFIVLFYIYVVTGLLCYNGTFTQYQFGEDPLRRKNLWRNHKSFSRLRCSLTTLCGVVCYLSKAKALFCYNCSTTHREREPCAGDFVTPTLYFNSSSHFLFNCTGARTMCFVRSWSLRAKHKWIVQRGCYQVGTEDQLFQDLSVPTRAMTCKHKRLADSEYKICLCQADWCNNAPSRIVHSPLTKNRMWMYIVCVDLLIRTHA